MLLAFIGFNFKQGQKGFLTKSKSLMDLRLQVKNLVAKGKYKEAQDLSKKLLRRLKVVIKQDDGRTPSSRAYFLTGWILEDLRGRLPPDFLHEPGLPSNYVNWTKYKLAAIYYKQGEYSKALNYLNFILKSAPDYKGNDRVLALSARIYEVKGDLLKEQSLLTQLIARYPKSWSASFAHLRLGFMYERKGDYSRAFKEYTNSKILPVITILNFMIMLLFSAFVFGIVFLISRLFFRKRLIEARAGPFRKVDLFVVFALLFTAPPLMSLFLLSLNYYFRNFFLWLHLEPTVFSLFLSDMLLLGICLLYLKKKYKLDNLSLGFFSRGIQYNVILPIFLTSAGIMIAIIFFSIISLTSVKIPESPIDAIAQNTFLQGNPIKIFLLFFMVTVAGPIAEEIVFRVFLIKSFAKYTNTTFAVIFSSLLFGFFHQRLILVPYFTVLGLIFAITYTKTKTIIPSIVTHSLYNFLLFGLGFLFMNNH